MSAVFTPGVITYDANWLASIGSRIALKADGMSKMLTLLTAVSFPVIFTAIYNNSYKQAASFYGLMLLSQAGLMGVFLASDALLFYFFWELCFHDTFTVCICFFNGFYRWYGVWHTNRARELLC